jgi:6-phosphogluconolactonase (cycloisomerase 2 family)
MNRTILTLSHTLGPGALATALLVAFSFLSVSCPNPTSDDGNSRVATGDGVIAVTGVTLDRATAMVLVGSTVQLTATVTPSDATDSAVTWSSSADAVAMVSNTGLVSGVAAGTASVTATTSDGGFSAAATVTVRTDPYPEGGSVQGVALDSLSSSRTLAGEPVNLQDTHDILVFDDDLYITSSIHAIFRIDSSTGDASIYSGNPDYGGNRDGTANYAQFNFLSGGGIATDGTNIYISDTDNHIIRKISPDGAVSTLAGEAGSIGNSDSTDGSGATARFNAPSDLAVVGNYIYVTDTGNNLIKRVHATTGDTEAFSGSGTPGSGDDLNGNGTGTGEYRSPTGVATDGATYLYVTDTGNHTIRRITIANRDVRTIAGLAQSSGYVNGTSALRFDQPRGITMVGNALYVADTGNNVIRQIDTTSLPDSITVSTLAGPGASTGTPGFSDGAAGDARFDSPQGIDSDGTHLFVTDTGNRAIRKVALVDGATSTVVHGASESSTFGAIRGITTDGVYLYVADRSDAVIRKVEIATGAASALAGLEQTRGSADGVGTSARFNFPTGVTTDGTHLYVADTLSYTIRRVDPVDGTTTTIAGTAYEQGADDGVGESALFRAPVGITTDGAHLYVADYGSNTIRRITIADGMVTTIAGAPDSYGTFDGIATEARFDGPIGITTDGSSLFVTERDGQAIRKINLSTHEVSTLAGDPGSMGAADGTGAQARFAEPEFLTCDGTNLFVADSTNHAIRKVVISTGAVTTLISGGTENGYANGSLAATKLMAPVGITSTADALYVTEMGNSTIRAIE